MGILQIELFGGMRITDNNWRTEVTITREIQSLLAYLLLQRQRVHSREALAGLFWGEQSEERARGSLSTALWKLKKILEPNGVAPGTYLKLTHLSEIGFNKESPHWLDVEVFEEKVSGILALPFQTTEESHIRKLKDAIRLYKGELLEGCYRDWALRERERLRALYLRGLTYLLEYYRFHRRYDNAIAYGQQILDLNPLQEEIHRELMKLYVENGQRALAVQQYDICRSILEKELGISPMEDTQSLLACIINGTSTNGSVAISRENINRDQALRQLMEATQTIDLAMEQIRRALELISRHP